MKKYLAIIFSLISILTSGQSVIIGKYPKIVPEGKKWILQTNNELLIEVPHGTLVSGTLCNALILSNPKIVQGIVEGDLGRPNEVYGIVFKDLYKVAYTNNYTYSIIPLAIIDSKFDTYDLQNKQPHEVGERQIFFYPGQKISVGVCIESLQLKEVKLSVKELLEIKQKREAKRQSELKKATEDEERKKQDEIIKRKKIVSSDEYFNSYYLTNRNDIQVIFKPEVLNVLYDYYEALKKKYPTAYKYSINNYKRNSSSYTTDRDKYFMFNLSVFFNKSGELTKITSDDLYLRDEGKEDTLIIESESGGVIKNIRFDDIYFNRLQPLISLNKAGSIRLDDKDYIVNFYTRLSFKFLDTYFDRKVVISKNKKGEMKIIEHNCNLSNSEITTSIQQNDKYSALEKGEYSFTFKFTNYKLIASYMGEYGKEEEISSQRQTNEITNIIKL